MQLQHEKGGTMHYPEEQAYNNAANGIAFHNLLGLAKTFAGTAK